MNNSTSSGSVSLNDVMSQTLALIKKNDDRYESMFQDILDETECLTTGASPQGKFDSILSIEYILLRLRLEMENESIKVRRIIADQNTPQSLRNIFLKRASTLSEHSVRLSTIRMDIEALSKVKWYGSPS